ncbi:MAG: S8 family serine peptidase, partial [Planctomycetales bacterium]|nr:S8 family serine peptidase [Planctomycetales bacterium]
MMKPNGNRASHHHACRLLRKHTLLRRGKRHLLRLQVEKLEARYLLAGTLSAAVTSPTEVAESVPSVNWFETVNANPGVLRSESISKFVGPVRINSSTMQATQTGQWIVQLSQSGADQIDRLADVDRLLDREQVNFDVVRGLGQKGLLLIEAAYSEEAAINNALGSSSFITNFSTNDSIRGTIAPPSDPLFPKLIGLNNEGQFGATAGADVDALEAWDDTTGSKEVVVAVIDSGIDPTHPDLYLNIWLNQGEITSHLANLLEDVDGDGLITFYDLNNLAVINNQFYVASTVQLDVDGNLISGDLATVDQLTTATPYATGANATYVRDLPDQDGIFNGRIDAWDLLADPLWSDGLDTEGNGFIDDFFGWNFHSGANEPFAPNNPSDVLGHGTHVAGTIGAIGNNGIGVTGVNWQSSIMSLKFLDANNSGSTADAIAAINYATMMKTTYHVNVPVTNSSWGQSGGSNPALRSAIASSGQADILFVAASGNGDSRDRGVNNDITPFYPASYDLDNIIAVGASDSRNAIASFSNYGLQSVDVLAPGVGVLSTYPDGRYEILNGTSMAAPHVAGTAALIHSRLPGVTVNEVKRAIIDSAKLNQLPGNQVASGGRINASRALNFSGFAPRAEFVQPPPVTIATGSPLGLTVTYRDRNGVDTNTIKKDNLSIRQNATGNIFTPNFVTQDFVDSTVITATYFVDAPGGDWDPLDFGSYTVLVNANSVRNLAEIPVVAGALGGFNVRIEGENSFYVNTVEDTIDVDPLNLNPYDASGNVSLRSAIDQVNQSNNQTYIFLDEGVFSLTR